VLSPRTAERHVQDVYARIGVSSRAAAALYAIRPPGIAPGPEGVRQQFEGFPAAFADFRASILDQVADGDMVTTRKVFHGTHRGPFMGFEPTGREVEIRVIDIVRVADGRIAEHWACDDRLGLLEQLGALSEPAVSARP
jgi:predicted ester cyclase